MRVASKSWVGAGVWLVGCTPHHPDQREVAPEVVTASEARDPIAVVEQLEGLIARGRDSEADRVYAYDEVRAIADDGTPHWAFARAAVAGRLAELRGAGAGKLVGETETHARLVLARDPDFREGEAIRMLATLYVKAPPRLVEHGDAEDGLGMLETLTEAHPEQPRNHLRLAEAYVELGETGAAGPHLCQAIVAQPSLRPDEQTLLATLVEAAGGHGALGCSVGGE